MDKNTAGSVFILECLKWLLLLFHNKDCTHRAIVDNFYVVKLG